MREKPLSEFETFRTGAKFGQNFGSMAIPYKSNTIIVVFCDGKETGWDHVSVSLRNRCPNWEEMSLVKNIFWDEDETVVQFHPKKQEYVNFHPYCLHMWKRVDKDIELPPRILI